MRRCRSRLPRCVEQSREGKIDSGFTPLPGIHVGGVERVDGSTARARRGSARRIRRGPLAPGITGRPAGVRSASAGSNVRRGARSTAKIERSRARVDFHGPSRGFDRVRARRPANISRVRCLPKRGRASGDAVTHGEGFGVVCRTPACESVSKALRVGGALRATDCKLVSKQSDSTTRRFLDCSASTGFSRAS